MALSEHKHKSTPAQATQVNKGMAKMNFWNLCRKGPKQGSGIPDLQAELSPDRITPFSSWIDLIGQRERVLSAFGDSSFRIGFSHGHRIPGKVVGIRLARHTSATNVYCWPEPDPPTLYLHALRPLYIAKTKSPSFEFIGWLVYSVFLRRITPSRRETYFVEEKRIPLTRGKNQGTGPDKSFSTIALSTPHNEGSFAAFGGGGL
ncbi:hypothetical protein B0H11DRAFT_1934574 [Mycena galericulata]|nr:hypothetical protein B0H11DRAFT_1934574 [Mycena galericulata]